MEFDSISEQMVFLRSRGVHHNTLVHNYSVYKGSQSVLFVPTHEDDPLRTHVNIYFMHRGVMVKPSRIHGIQLSTSC